MNPFDKPIDFNISGEGVRWKDDCGVVHFMTAKGVIEHLQKFYNEYYCGFEELEAVLTRYRKMHEDYNLLKETLMWIQRNPEAHPNNIQTIIKTALDEVKS